MRKANIFKRILSCMLVLTLIMSGLGLDLGGVTKDNVNNVIDVEASTGDYSAMTDTPNGGGGGDSAGIDGGCYRISLVPSSIMKHGKSRIDVNKIRDLLSNRVQYSVLVSEKYYRQTVHFLNNRGAKKSGEGRKPNEKGTQITASTLHSIFGCRESGWNNNSEKTVRFCSDIGEWVGDNFIMDTQCNSGYFGEQGPFQRWLGEGNNKIEAVQKFKKYVHDNSGSSKLNIDIPDGECIIVVEPVIISIPRNGEFKHTGLYALSYQDCIGSSQDGSKWSYAFTKLAYPSKTCPYTYLDGPYKSDGNWASALRSMRSAIFEFKDTRGTFGKINAKVYSGRNLNRKTLLYSSEGAKCDTGFGLFGAGIGTSTAKVGVSYTLFSNDTSLSDNAKISSVQASLNVVHNDNYDTIHTNNYNGASLLDLNSKATDLVASTYGKSVVNPFNNNKAGSKDKLSKQLTGYNNSEWNTKCENYVNADFGVKKLIFNTDLNNFNTGKLYKTVVTNMTVSKLATSSDKLEFKSVQNQVTSDDGGLVAGSTYNIKLSDDSNIATSVSDILRCSNSDIFDSAVRVFGTKVENQRANNNVSNLAINGALYAIKSSKEVASFTKDNFSTLAGEDIDEGDDISFEDVKDNSAMGVSVTLMIKKNLIKSYLACATLDRDTGNISNNTKSSVKYDVSESGLLKVPSSYTGRCFYAIVPNTESYSLEKDTDGSTIFNSFKGNKELSSVDEFLTKITEVTGVNNFYSWGEVCAGKTIHVGATNKINNKVKGYSVIVLEVKGNATKKSELELMDYELNYVYPSMITDGKYASLLTDISYQTTGTETLGSGCNAHWSHISISSYDKYVVSDASNYKGNIINKNLGLGVNKNILRYDDYIGLDKKFGFTTEQSARQGNTFVNNLTDNNRLVRFSLAVNLIRSSFGDKRVLSSITSQKSNDGVVGGIDENYAKDNLELTFANKPNTQAPASKLRNSNATVGNVLEDMFEWNTSYVTTDCSPYKSNKLTHVYNVCRGHTHSDGNGGSYTTYCSPTTWYEIVKTEVPASDFGSKVKYKVSEKAFKYQTASLDTGKNNTKTVADSLQKPTNGKGSNSSLVSPYKIAVVHSSSSELSFYPEVGMRAYSSTGDTITNDNMSSGSGTNRSAGGYVTPHNLLTMGEVIRKVKPSAMYVIRVNHKYDSGAEVNPAIKGSTISDSTAVGTNADAVSDGKPVIYAGGDVTVKVNPDFRLNMYGYSLDLIETSDNNLVGTGNYASIINDSSNVKRDWGNTYTSTAIKKEFDDWSKDILTKHLGVDMTLTVNGSGVDKVFNNFTSSLGNMDTSASVADGVYSIKIKQGTIVKDDVDGKGYKALIKQIMKDYELSSEVEAEKIFTNSDIWQSIERAVEDCNDSFNNSQKSDAIDDSRAHWYDEEVKTFVIRRYKKENLEIKNVVVNDKIDYGAAPTADDTTASLDSYKKADAKWYMTLYLKKDGAKKTPDGFSDSTVYYNPSHHDGLSNANDTGSVLINEVYVDGADFVIPSASTYDMGN